MDRFLILIFALVWTLQPGCEKPPEIRQYSIAKDRSDLGDLGNEPLVVPQQNRSSAVPARMVVGILEKPDATWFFKLTGPVDAVNKVEDQWKQIFASIEIGDDGKPKWETPEGWKLGPAKPMRFATLMFEQPGPGKLELSISNLGPDQNLLDNVNRWLGQLDKPSIQQDELQLDTLQSGTGEIKIFDEQGVMMLESTGPQVSQPRVPEFTHMEMNDWTAGNVNDIVKVRLKKGTERTAPQITVTQLLAAANEWIPNAQRWARQVEMDDSEEFARENSSPVTVDGIKGDKIRLIPDSEDAEFAAIGIMVVRDNLAWFFKIIGDRKQVLELESEFDAFVESFSFK